MLPSIDSCWFIVVQVVLTRQLKLSSFKFRKEPEYQIIFLYNFVQFCVFDLYAHLRTYRQTDG